MDYLRTSLGSSTSNASPSKLIRMLDDHEAVTEVLAVPSSIITEQQLHALTQVARHFGILNDDDESGDDPDEETKEPDEETSDRDEGDTSRARKSARKARPKVKAWAPFLRIKSLKLPPSVQQHLTEHGSHPEGFLSDHEVFKHRIFECADHEAADAFMACYQYTLELVSRRTKDNLRWCFIMLLYYDLVRLIKPNWSGKVGHLMLTDMRRFLGAAVKTTNIDTQTARKEIETWANCGKHLALLCATFGPGCIFYLSDLLSPNFLRNVFTASGASHDDAFAHLQQLGLKEAALESGADRLGADAREVLIRPFRRVAKRTKRTHRA